MGHVPVAAFIKGLKETVGTLFSKPVTVEYPENLRNIPENARNRITLYLDLCIGCTSCSMVCPNATCQMEPIDYQAPRNKRGIFPRVDIVQCMYCGLCEEACPTDAIRLEKEFETADYERTVFDYDPYELSKSEGTLELEQPFKKRPRGEPIGSES